MIHCQKFREGKEIDAWFGLVSIIIYSSQKLMCLKMNENKHQETPNSVENRLDSLNAVTVETDVVEIVEKESNVTNGDEFRIFIKIPDGETYALIAKSTYEISKVLRILGVILGDDEIEENVTLSYAGTPLQSELTLGYYNISKDSTLFLNGIICGDVVDSGKFSRLTNLFRSLITGLSNQNDIFHQLNTLTKCECISDLKEYDRVYPPKCI